MKPLITQVGDVSLFGSDFNTEATSMKTTKTELKE